MRGWNSDQNCQQKLAEKSVKCARIPPLVCRGSIRGKKNAIKDKKEM